MAPRCRLYHAVDMSAVTRIAPSGTRNLRKGRVSIPNQIYHVTTRTRDYSPVFADLRAGRILIDRLRCEEERGRASTIAFVVMPDHLHWLLQLTGHYSLSRVVNDVKANAARLINNVTEKKGPLWQRGFYDRAIRNDEDLIAVSRYIVANPLRAGIVKSVRDYALWDSIWV